MSYILSQDPEKKEEDRNQTITKRSDENSSSDDESSGGDSASESDISDLSFNTGLENMSEVDEDEGEVDDGTSDRPSGNTNDFKKFADVLMGMEKRLNLRIANLESKFQTTIKNEIIDQRRV